MDVLHLLAFILAIVGILIILWDTFETIVVPKTVQRRLRVSSVYSNLVWKAWHRIADTLPDGGFRRALLGSFGPLAILFLFFVWATLLVVGFGIVHWSLGDMGPDRSFPEYLYFSGVTFFTLGYGDMSPVTGPGRFAAVLQTGTGYAFLAIVIAFVPTLYQAFSRREKFIVMMDARAGSHPTAGEVLRRYAEAGAMGSLIGWLAEAESWCAEQLENYLSYPILAYYRSQHDDQSWLAAMTAVLDTCALVLAAAEGDEPWIRELRFQASATFAMGRHVIVDLAYIIDEPPVERAPSRMTPPQQKRLGEILALAWNVEGDRAFHRLLDYQARYEPYLIGLAKDMQYVLPAWTQVGHEEDNWERSAWDGPEHF